MELRRDDVLLGNFSNIRLYDWPWYECDFQAAPAVEQYRQLFKDEVELLEDKGANDKWDAAYEKIEALELTLIYPYEGKSTKIFVLHIEQDKARFNPVFDKI